MAKERDKHFWESLAHTYREDIKKLKQERDDALEYASDFQYKVERYDQLLETFKKVLVQNVQLQNEILERDCK